MVLRKKVFILFKVEKHLSASDVVIGVIIKICSSLVIFENVDPKFSSLTMSNIAIRVLEWCISVFNKTRRVQFSGFLFPTSGKQQQLDRVHRSENVSYIHRNCLLEEVY